MKKNIKYIAASVLLCLGATGCREEHLLGGTEGVGRMNLSASVMDEIKVVSRALTSQQHNELSSSALIWISRVNSDESRDLLFKYEGLASFPDDGLPLESGHYLAEVWTGDSIPASWEGIRYHGTTPFEIVSGDEIDVDVVCTVRNTLVDIRLSDGVRDVLSDVAMTVSLDEEGMPDGLHSLTFEGETLDATGYFMINTKTRGLKWTLTGTDLNGQPFSHSGVYTDPSSPVDDYLHGNHGLSRATRYIFNVNYDGESGEVELGGAYLDINVEPEPVEGTSVSEIISLAPQYLGADKLDLDAPILREPGNAGRISFQVISSSSLASVKLEGDMLRDMLGTDACDLMAIEADVITRLSDAGIVFKPVDKRSESELADGEFVPTNMHISLEETFMNSLPIGDYSLTVSAKDAMGKESSRPIAFSITEVPGVLGDVADVESTVTYTTATLSATVMKPGDKMGFEVMQRGKSRVYEDWTFVPGVLDGDKLTAQLTDLQAGCQYDYRLVIDAYTSAAVQTFSTQAYPQLPNAGFEEWSSYSGVTIPGSTYPGSFWDSGNHGGSMANTTLTEKDTTVKHGGSCSAKLETKFASVFGLGKLAAGNIFTGKYIATDGTDGVLGFGQPFTCRPKALKGWVKYIPAKVTDAKSNPGNMAKDDMDQGIIYIALLSDHTEESNGESWPVVIKTKSSARQLFNPQADNVIAYGEKIFTEATAGEGMVEFTIPLDDVHGSLEVANIMIVASASRYGDYFTGGRGSTMWLDDFELVY